MIERALYSCSIYNLPCFGISPAIRCTPCIQTTFFYNSLVLFMDCAVERQCGRYLYRLNNSFK